MGILTNIYDGKYDADLDRIETAVRQRKANLIFDLNPGDKVKFGKSVRPIYLQGKVATIKTYTRTRVVVDLDLPSGRYYKGIRCTPNMLIPVVETNG